jgi:hypothetical protein
MRRARILMARGLEEEAAAACTLLLEQSENSPAFLARLAEVFADRYPAFAYPYALAAAEKEPENGDIAFLCVNICMALDDLSGAQRDYARAAALGVKKKGAHEKAVELLYRQRLPEALAAAETLPATVEGLLLKAKIYDEVATPPRTAEAIGLLTAAVKTFPDNLALRELYVAMLRKKRAFLRLPLENARLETLRRRLKREQDAVMQGEFTVHSS